MRLIDADALMEDCYIVEGNTTVGRRTFVYFYEVEDAPTIDAVKVVRCKECEEWEPSMVMHGRGVCAEWSDYDNGRIRYTNGNDYCCYGERVRDD